ncbi:hypothetical protein PHYBLDRAFT_72105 [Phycomyces blakesleeanus NRRL 1555(-)]|uniref:Retrotransposon gag domain-containing protein n=1 Tax=Phycomyces blakesleeanus (strain ATCC 8743b / DSM 1359 / FGSC 10004 / NBRC 33097 / NRRL 1555) TaxID=763407 RepID=A0A163DIT7_PHYB8|nr:hypothetical protein PHYBLDRAFT_72105 [Phycomyces blakesleeanus NRRL 1555(-)]OAD71530.1 hypothetical protein PHYBLDRAFT_72105 [Phycomyces blakesleeanus NRRL 1555(-)]|eukprot:XP_018289570.1 hypothetical protein PHYBLDRAFT_72105 [Phycomyces blakesleeanus NRRL 1555(-)]
MAGCTQSSIAPSTTTLPQPKPATLQCIELKTDHPAICVEFKTAVTREFHLVYSLQTSRDQLAQLQQTVTVTEYIDTFQDIQLELPEMNNEEVPNKFVHGLHPSICENVLAAHLVDVNDACNIALAYASGLQLEKFSSQASISNEPIKPKNSKDILDQYTNVINEEHKAISEEKCDPCLTADQNFLEDLHAAVDTDLPLYAAILNGQQILVLIDSGASTNYVSPQIAQLATHTLDIPGRSVETAGEHNIKINQKATLNIALNGYSNTVETFVFPTKFDLILCCTWLQAAKLVPD